MSRHDHDREQGRAGLQAFQKLDTVDARHADVGDDASKFNVGKGVEEMMSRLEKRDVKVGGAEHEIQRIPHRLVVVDDIDLSPMWHLSNSRLMRRAT